MKTKKPSLSMFDKRYVIPPGQYANLTPEGRAFAEENQVRVGLLISDWQYRLKVEEGQARTARDATASADRATEENRKMGHELERLRDENNRLRQCVSLLATSEPKGAWEQWYQNLAPHPVVRVPR